MRRRLVSIVLGCGLLVACAVSPPVQEMSDARQAIQAAEAAGANSQTDPSMRKAQELIEQAQQALELRQYGYARRLAIDARQEALDARAHQSGSAGGNGAGVVE